LDEARSLFGCDLPVEYIWFMKSHNGARFFAGAISIYGWGTTVSRGTSLAERSAILLDSMHREYRLLERAEWSQGWRPVGGLVAKNRHRMTLNSEGVFRLKVASGRERSWTSFAQMLADCIAAADVCFDCDGITGVGYSYLEEMFESLASQKN
jgi:hypothetical protein